MRGLVVGLVLMFAVPAFGAGGIVLEAYTGQRAADANRLLGPVLDELAARGFSAGDTVARQIDSKVSRAADDKLPGDFSAQVDKGFRLWVSGKFDDAIKVLVPLVDLAHANSGAFVRDPSLREPLNKALIVLAIAQQRTGDPSAARATFGEVLRAFPESQVSRGTYGPDAAELYETVRRELAAAGKGKLTVKTDDGAVVFVDEVFRGTSTTELSPGEYRVTVMLNKVPSRSHRVVVNAGNETTITVDAKLDQALHTDGWTGFAFGSESERDAHEAPYAAKIATSVGASAVAVVGIEQVRGRPAIVGSLVSLSSGREIRRASVAMEPDPSTDRLKALAKYLAGEEPASGIEVQPLDAAPKETPTGVAPETSGGGGVVAHDEVGGGRWGGWKWITAAVGVGGLGTGAVLLALDGSCSKKTVGTPCPVYDFKAGGIGTIAGGAVFAGISAYLFATQSKEHPKKTAFLAPTGDGAVVGIAGSW
ncbi:MAG: hypothetical protein JO257_37790 [Deltaproteobacteria bacterium]|nr:hypothetical protein [Deltaproteobacteria bacterium]